MSFPWHQYLLAVIFIAAGANHFRKPKIYERIMPPYFPQHKALIMISGILEMVLGFMLITKGNEAIGSWGIIGLLVLFFPVHVYMLQNEKASLKMPKWLLLLRFPIQLALIYWAYIYT